MDEHYVSYMWSVDDWRHDELWEILDNREKGIYRELIDQCFIAGSISSDTVILARFVHEPIEYFQVLWEKIRSKFVAANHPDRLTSRRLERDRDRLNRIRARRSKAGKTGGKASGKARKNKASNSHGTNEIGSNRSDLYEANDQAKRSQTQTQTQKEESSPLLDLPNTETSSVLPDGDPAEKRAGRRLDSAYESFIETFEREQQPAKYPRDKNRGKDFTQLAALRKIQGLNGQSPPDWDKAIENYFASPMASRSVADLATRYADFVKWPLDRYGKPIGGNGNGQPKPDDKTQRILERTRRINQQLFSQDTGESGSGNPGRESRDLHAGSRRPE